MFEWKKDHHHIEGMPSFLELPIRLNGLTDRVDFFTEFGSLLGVRGEVIYVEVKPLGSFINEVDHIIVIATKGRYEFVLKTFSSWGLLKWFPLWIASYARANFSISGKSRLKNELRARLVLRKAGVKTPYLYCYDMKRMKALYEFIEGENLDEKVKAARRDGDTNSLEDVYRRAGLEVARIHSSGYILGDCKPANVIYSNTGQLYYVDLEQARGGNIRLSGWDVCEFIMFTGRFFLLPKKARKLCEAFLQGYLEEGDKRVLREAASIKMSQPFVGLVSPAVFQSLRSLMLEHAE
ncbi:MAG: hypothetical protein KIH01_03870 [Candidatus Freyarchaeota archaeon]|nr:hypothetical protein [Candidatus Jordarchaeia archaeon]